jgi:hypothetical protein
VNENLNPKTIRIFSSDGQLVFIGDFMNQINVRKLNSGIYFVQLEFDNKQGVKNIKFIKE